MNFRSAVENDAPAILQLVRQLGYHLLDETGILAKMRSYSSADNAIMVGEIEGVVVGFISLHIFEIFHSPGKAGRITAFCVDENFRSQGVGIAMLKESEQYFRSHGCTKVEVTSNMRRSATHAFYIKRGYSEDSKKFVLAL
jgi:GNAT superfamily N-acetyltransferase